MFEMYDYALVSQRLSRTFVFVQGRYRYIMSTDVNEDNNNVFAFDEEMNKLRLGKLGTPAPVSYVNMRIGMIALKGILCWTFRNSVRKWKVGLNSGNYCLRGLGHGPQSYVSRGTIEANLPAIFDMLNGKYCSITEARRTPRGAPISRRFGIYEDWLYYKSFRVGEVMGKTRLQLDKKYGYLTQRLEQEVPCIR